MSIAKATDTSTAATNTTGRWLGGGGSFFAIGTFSGSTARCQWSIDGTSWTNVANTSLAADGTARLTLGPCQLRINVTSTTAAKSLTVVAREDGQMK